MNTNGNFLEFAGQSGGLDVGFGKLILVYKDFTNVAITSLNATSINASVASGDIVGIVRGWNTIAGASVAEVNIERTATKEKKLIHSEILADVLTFENNLATNEVINDLVKAGTLPCIFVDDQGNAFGDNAKLDRYLKPMKINFSGKTTSSFQKDNVTEKTVAVTLRYLVKDLIAIVAEIETEGIESKTLLLGQIITSGASDDTGYIHLNLTEKASGAIPDIVMLSSDVTVKCADASIASATAENGVLVISLESAASLLVVGIPCSVTLSGDDFYMKEMQFTLANI